jgi:hypothetical protein
VVEGEDQQLAVSWSAVANATVYEVWYHTDSKLDDATQWTGAGAITGTTTTITGLAKDTIYYVWINAGNGTFTSPFSPYASNRTSELIVITSVADFGKIGKATTHPANGWYRLDTDLILPDWAPLPAFSGKLDGNGKTIALDVFDEEAIAGLSNVGIFSEIKGTPVVKAELKNMTIAVGISSMIGIGNTGVLAGTIDYANLSNITVTGFFTTTVGGGGSAFGGIAGSLSNSAVSRINSGLAITPIGFNYTGGIAGLISNSVVSYVTISRDLTANTPANSYVGGIAGQTSAGAVLDHCRVTGNVSHINEKTDAINSLYTGGLVGYQNVSRIKSSYSTGNVLSNAPYSYSQVTTGGITGTMRGTAGAYSIEDCYSTGDIATTARSQPYAAGIIGFVYQQGGPVTRCYARGTITVVNSRHYAAGIAGSLQAATVSVSNCVALTPEITGTTTSLTYAILHRVVSQLSQGTITNNRAYSGMTLKAIINGVESPATIGEPSPDGLEGSDCVQKPDQAFYEALGWDFTNVWQMAGEYPALRGF